MRVGEKEVSEQAAIIARYSSLFSREQLDSLREAEAEAAVAGDERERLYRLRKTCEGGLISAELADALDALENAELQSRVVFRGEEMPLRNAQAQLAVLPEYGDRDELGLLQMDVSAALNPQRLELLQIAEPLAGELSGIADPVARSDEEKGISLRGLAEVLDTRPTRLTEGLAGGRRGRGGSSNCSVPSATTSRSRSMCRGCAGSRRSPARTRRSGRRRSASRRSRSSASTCRPRGRSGSTSTTARRRARAPA